MKKRTYFFIHQNMPAQFVHLCIHLRDRGHNVVFITRNKVNQIGNTTKVMYEPSREPKADTHPYMRSLEDGILHGQAVFRSITNLLNKGYKPDIVIGHAGWGETLSREGCAPEHSGPELLGVFLQGIRTGRRLRSGISDQPRFAPVAAHQELDLAAVVGWFRRRLHPDPVAIFDPSVGHAGQDVGHPRGRRHAGDSARSPGGVHDPERQAAGMRAKRS